MGIRHKASRCTSIRWRLRLSDFLLVCLCVCVYVPTCVCVCYRGVIFKGTTIGMAPLEGMCSLENSGGINVVCQDPEMIVVLIVGVCEGVRVLFVEVF